MDASANLEDQRVPFLNSVWFKAPSHDSVTVPCRAALERLTLHERLKLRGPCSIVQLPQLYPEANCGTSCKLNSVLHLLPRIGGFSSNGGSWRSILRCPCGLSFCPCGGVVHQLRVVHLPLGEPFRTIGVSHTFFCYAVISIKICYDFGIFRSTSSSGRFQDITLAWRCTGYSGRWINGWYRSKWRM